MKLKIHIILLFLLIVLVFNFCKKKDPPFPEKHTTSLKPYRTVRASSDIKDLGYFKIGSYWIYRDSVSGVLDSVYVTGTDTSYYRVSYKSDSDIVVESMNVYFSSASFLYKIMSSSYPHDRISSVNYVGEGFTVYDSDTTKLVSYPGSGISKNANVSVLNVLGTNYYGSRYIVYQYSFIVHSGGIYWIAEELYWQKNIGIIKKFPFPSSTRRPKELIRYNVIQ